MLWELDDRRVKAQGAYFVAENATVVGSVELGEGASIWFGAVLRGDADRIVVGAGSNVQDGAVLHTDPGFPLLIGESVTVGHKVMLHGCQIGDNSLIGINAVVLNGARIGANCLIGAGALITEGKEIPDNSVVMGAPGKVVKTLGPEQVAGLKASAAHYVSNGQRFRDGLRPQTSPDPLDP
jgi:carbonic anhydrase/acetyltransferase-like protein (isoleucine patch superfamily)